MYILYMPKGANISDDSMLVKRTNTLGMEIETDSRTADAMVDEAVYGSKTS